MKKKRFLHIFLLVVKKMMDPYYQGVAAELAYFFLLSLVPIGILLSQMLGVFSISAEAMTMFLDQYMASDMTGVLSELFIHRSTSGAMSVALIVVALWAASKAQFSMSQITNYTFTGQATGKGYIKERLRAIKNIVFTLFTLVFSLLILVYGELIIGVITAYAEKFLGVTFILDKFWYLVRWPISLALYFLMISYNYYALPTEKVLFKEILPGSILASIGMLLATGLYTYYVRVFANYDILYGSLASIVALLFWFYLLGYILVVGIQFNAAWKDTK